jgi:uncharacterized phiE125 gp8 family phage protein
MVEYGIAPPAVSLAEVQAYARIETGEEEALLAGLLRTASALCESFTGQLLVSRTFAVMVSAGHGWQRLPPVPVRSIGQVEVLAADGIATAISASDYEVDIDSRGNGWVRLLGRPNGRIRVSGTAGLAEESNGVPEPLRQGIMRLVAHLFAARDGDDGEPPAAVTALWRPYRRIQLA